MAGRPAKTLPEHVRDGTFRARRHHQLLAGPDLPWAGFARLQQRFRRASSEPERRAIGVEFEQAVTLVHQQANEDGHGAARLDDALGTLGPTGSAKQLLAFFPAFLAHPKGPKIGQPFQLEAWQKGFLRELVKRDKHGRRLYRLGVLGVPRGNGKTPLAAGLGLFELVTRADAAEIVFAAGSKDQAGIGLGFARDFVDQGPLADWIQLRSTLACPVRRSTMRVISSEGRLQHGLAPAVAVVDELWAFQTASQEQTYVALSTALHKREDAFLLVLTTAGYDQHSLLGRIYQDALTWPSIRTSKDGCLTVVKDEANGNLLWWYAAPEAADLEDEKVWRQANPASWIQIRDLKRQLHDPGLDELEFRRLHLNQWTRTREAWLPSGCWQSLITDQQIPDGADIYLGVDVGLYHDSTAVCWAHILEDGRILLTAHVWSAKEDAAAHTFVPGGKVRLEQVEQFIRDLRGRYRIREIAYDPRFFARSAEILEHERLTLVEFHQASAPMADAYQSFYQAALEGRLAHTGDPILTQHIDATAATKTEHGWKVYKLKNSRRIDATVACVLAHARAQANTRRKPGPTIRWMEW
jgi:phage terminase large subunit-like protein